MAIALRVYERTLSQGAKRGQQKILGIIRLDNNIKDFIFGRNPETRYYLPEIMSYPFIEKKEGELKLWAAGKSYKFKDTSRDGISLRTKVSFLFWNFGKKETMLERNDPIQIVVGDELVIRDKKAEKEIVLEVAQVY